MMNDDDCGSFFCMIMMRSVLSMNELSFQKGFSVIIIIIIPPKKEEEAAIDPLRSSSSVDLLPLLQSISLLWIRIPNNCPTEKHYKETNITIQLAPSGGTFTRSQIIYRSSWG